MLCLISPIPPCLLIATLLLSLLTIFLTWTCEIEPRLPIGTIVILSTLQHTLPYKRGLSNQAKTWSTYHMRSSLILGVIGPLTREIPRANAMNTITPYLSTRICRTCLVLFVQDRDTRLVQWDQAYLHKCVAMLHEKTVRMDLFMKLIYNRMELLRAKVGGNLVNKIAGEQSPTPLIIKHDSNPTIATKDCQFSKV